MVVTPGLRYTEAPDFHARAPGSSAYLRPGVEGIYRCEPIPAKSQFNKNSTAFEAVVTIVTAQGKGVCGVASGALLDQAVNARGTTGAGAGQTAIRLDDGMILTAAAFANPVAGTSVRRDVVHIGAPGSLSTVLPLIRRHAHDERFVRQLRLLLQGRCLLVHRMSDRQVVNEIANRIAVGELVLIRANAMDVKLPEGAILSTQRSSNIPGMRSKFADGDLPAVVAFLKSLSGNARVMERLSELLKSFDGRPRDYSPDELIEKTAEHVVARRLWLLTPAGGGTERAEAQPAGPAVAPRRAPPTTWIEIKVIHDDTGEPVSGVRLRLVAPDGIENFYTTSSAGLIRAEGLKPGQCSAWCDIKQARLTDTLDFAGTGPATTKPASSDSSGAASKSSAPAQPARPARQGMQRIATIDRHHVKTGDTLDSLAKAAGMTWQDLAMFNWGTSTPKEINTKLRDEVGCTKKTADGANYVFDDSDDPGIVLIPKEWEKEGLATAEQHVIRVKVVQSLAGHVLQFNFQLESGQPIVDGAGFRLTGPNGAKENGTLSEGSLRRTRVPEGEYHMEFFFIRSAAWSVAQAHADEQVQMKCTTKGFDDGTAIQFRVMRRFQPRDAEPLAAIDAKISNSAATVAWRYEQAVEQPSEGEFVFEVIAGEKRALSEVLTLVAYPLDDLKGVQERLKQLGYDPGPIDGIMGPKTSDAVKAFQTDNPPLRVDGDPGPRTKAELAHAWY